MVEITQADNDLLVEITEWLIGEDAIDEENQKQLNRLGEFMEPRLAKHRLATIAALEQPTPELVEAVAKATYLAYINHPNADWTAVDQAMKDGIWYPQAKAALAAAAKHLKGEG